MSYTCIHLLVHYHIGTSLFSRKKGIQKQNPDLVPNSRPIPDHFWHFGPDPDPGPSPEFRTFLVPLSKRSVALAEFGWGEWREEDLKDASQVVIAQIIPCLLLLLSRVCCRIQGWIFVPKVPPSKFSNCEPVSKFWTLLSNLSLN